MADEQDIPPYVIFPDTTLMEMSYYYPQTKESLLSVYAVGEAKLKRYGSECLSIIQEYCRERGMEGRTTTLYEKKEKNLEQKQADNVGEEYGKGKSISHVAEQFGVKQATIMINLKKYFAAGHKIGPEGLLAASSLTERKKDEVFTSMETHGSSILKPVYEDLNKSVDYGELRILQLAYEAQKRE